MGLYRASHYQEKTTKSNKLLHQLGSQIDYHQKLIELPVYYKGSSLKGKPFNHQRSTIMTLNQIFHRTS
ncbi:hypothetical protein AAC03nite_03920 [Alicyclobacillus acidoterrestris]|nr:hypothetical protein AAC03nite_03920 [Alicyclobacillus acidoterrestris]